MSAKTRYYEHYFKCNEYVNDGGNDEFTMMNLATTISVQLINGVCLYVIVFSVCLISVPVGFSFSLLCLHHGDINLI